MRSPMVQYVGRSDRRATPATRTIRQWLANPPMGAERRITLGREERDLAEQERHIARVGAFCHGRRSSLRLTHHRDDSLRALHEAAHLGKFLLAQMGTRLAHFQITQSPQSGHRNW